jgi:hypothetical protein
MGAYNHYEIIGGQMLYLASWSVSVEKANDVLFLYEQVGQGKIPGLNVTTYVTMGIENGCWNGVSILEADSHQAVHQFLVEGCGMLNVQVKPCLKDQEAMLAWRQAIRSG